MGRPGRLAGVLEGERGSESPGRGVAGTWKVLGLELLLQGVGSVGRVVGWVIIKEPPTRREVHVALGMGTSESAGRWSAVYRTVWPRPGGGDVCAGLAPRLALPHPPSCRFRGR